MAGVAGRSGGSNAKRPEAKLGRPNTAADATPGFTRIDASGEAPPIIPEPEAHWHKSARLVWEAMTTAPTRVFAESPDWAYLYLTCEAIHQLAENGYKAMALTAVHSMMRDLGLTELQRRQAKLLIDRTPAPPKLAPVTQIDAARKAFE